MTRTRGAALIGLAALLAASPLSSAPEMSETTLPSGVRVVLWPVRTNPVVCSAVLVRAGVAWEPEGLSGASHFLEHLLFNGTTTRTQEQLYADVDRIGAYNNATTRADHTLFLLLAPREHLDAALEIQSDMLLRSTLPEDKFEKEKGIVLEEMGRDANDPSSLADRFFDERLHAGSPYARPVLGTVESIRGLAREAVLDYYRERYVPQRMVVFVAGDFDPAAALASVERHFRPATGSTAPPAAEPIPVPALALSAETLVHHQRVEAGRSYVRAAFPAPAADAPEAAAFGLFVELLGGGASPLDAALTEGDTPAVYDYSLEHRTTGGVGALVFSATATGAVPATEIVRTARAEMLRTLREHRIDPEDLRRLRESRMTEDATLAEQVHYYALFRVPGLLEATADEFIARAAERREVGIDELERTGLAHLASPRALVTVSGPDEEDGRVERVELADSGSSAGPAPVREAASATTVLDNGLTLSVTAEPAARVFAAHLIARNRSALEPPDREGLADLVHHLLLRGTAVRDATGLTEELSGLGANVNFFDDPRLPFDDYRTTPAYSYAMIEARAEREGEALRLFAEILQTPRFDADEIERERQRMADLASRKSESASAVASGVFRDLVAPEHALARRVEGRPGSLDGVGREDVVRMHAELFAPRNLILVVYGAGSVESLARRATALFGGRGPGGGWMPGEASAAPGVPTALVAPPPITTAAARAERALDKRQSHLALGGVAEVAADDEAALEVATLLLSHRLQMDLRETQGLAYSIGASRATLGAGRDLIAVSMGTAADNLEHAEREIRRVAAELREQPVPREQLETVVAAHRGRILMRRLPRQNRARYDGLRLLHGRPGEGDLEFLDRMGAVTPEQARDAARRYIDPERWAVAVAR